MISAMRTEYWILNTAYSSGRRESIQNSVCQYSVHAKRAAFTLIELMVVVAIMGIVLTISVPFMHNAISGDKGMNGAVRMVQEACSTARAWGDFAADDPGTAHPSG